ncbi:FAD-dependent oxidoreductase [Microbacterium sp. SORGH_AS_0862]|uniref:FAD-dependent oxidoreductase n=1 Tax=Microbacterium sp. SORGH_AS_0862 TaxID=3041789 RepID=UPI0027939E75|nr:FAD-dependent oxidoreductase [Microbacterium sp. SORGH_AS_0862]MDQ1204823.1 2-polyprenyl-6-methoxyphenol hydroxylase-like FAD-dependent oxidoreductase [Microbacterium sp. SORGH_AS_0862]
MSVSKVLVVGGGFTGLTTAIALAQRGVERVVVIDRARSWARVGHGLTIQGNALRVFRELGVLDRILSVGQPENALTLYFADGRVMAEMKTPRTGGDDLPATIGALRADLHEILVERAESLGVEIRLGRELASYESGPDEAISVLSDGTRERWDAIVIAEGIKSAKRAGIGISAQRGPSGLGIWRAVTTRQPEMTGGIAYPAHTGGAYKVGYTPVSDDLCYIFVLCSPVRPDNGLADWQEVKRLMADFHGPFDYLRESIDEGTFLNFQEIEWIFADGPWHSGRVIALGEVVHAVPPLIAQGAAQCVEDALLFAEHVTAAGDWETQLADFYARRLPRIRGVVEASMQLAEWELHPGTPGADPGRVMGQALGALVAAP